MFDGKDEKKEKPEEGEEKKSFSERLEEMLWGDSRKKDKKDEEEGAQ